MWRPFDLSFPPPDAYGLGDPSLYAPTGVNGGQAYMDPGRQGMNQFMPQQFQPVPFPSAPRAQPGADGSAFFKTDNSPLRMSDSGAMDTTGPEEVDDSEMRKHKKRKLNGVPKGEKPKRSILEEMLIILDEGTHGINWCLKVDTEGDIQDGMQIYNDAILEQTLEERRGVVGYGLSKHLAKDLRYYGFVYDRESKIFWNEDHKHPLTHRSYWQKDDRSKCLQLKRMTSEAERNLSRLTSLSKNVQLAEILKVPEHGSICPPPSKYIVLSELHTIFPTCQPSDAHNIKLLLAHHATNDVIRSQWEHGHILTKSFDHLMTRLGTSCPDFIGDLREFVAGAVKWYHGVMERDEAVLLLQGQPEGTFLIRESTQSDCYSLSWVKSDPLNGMLLVNHMRVEQTSAGFAVHGDDSPTRTLVQWIGTHSTYLKHPLASQRYCQLSVVQTSEKRLYNSSNSALPDNYLRGFPSRMETSSPSSPASNM